MKDLKDIDPSKWMEEDDKAELEAWDMVMSEVPKIGEMDEEVRETLKNVFSLGFNLGVKHQAERMKVILEILKALVKEKGL